MYALRCSPDKLLLNTLANLLVLQQECVVTIMDKCVFTVQPLTSVVTLHKDFGPIFPLYYTCHLVI